MAVAPDRRAAFWRDALAEAVVDLIEAVLVVVIRGMAPLALAAFGKQGAPWAHRRTAHRSQCIQDR